MPIRITPTLELMAGIYQLSSSGGAESDRFKAYLRAAPTSPVHGYNPMTSQPIIETIQELIALEAEALAEEAANSTAKQIGFETDADMHLSIATPGMWTDRLASEIDHRLKANDPGGILLWNDGSIAAEHIHQETVAQTTRLKATKDRQNQAPSTLAEAVAQEGRALSFAGNSGAYHHEAAEILAKRAQDRSLATMVAFLYGDDDAITMATPYRTEEPGRLRPRYCHTEPAGPQVYLKSRRKPEPSPGVRQDWP